MAIYNDLFGVPERKKSINSKRKGNDNEWHLSKALTTWVGTPFGRVPSSGGLRWQGESRFIGDVVAQDETFKFPFTIETKSYNKLVLKNGKFSKLILKFWSQCLEDCKRSSKLPMLVVRENNMPSNDWYVFFKLDDLVNDCVNKKEMSLETIDGVCFWCISMKNLSKIPYQKFLSLIKKV